MIRLLAPVPPSVSNPIEPPVGNRRDSLGDAILDIVRRVDWASFAELPRRLAEARYTNAAGDATIELPGNIVLWSGLSIELVDAIQSLLDSEQVFLHPVSVLVYMADGAALRLPLAQRVPPGGYRSPHWLPACLRTVAPTRADKR